MSKNKKRGREASDVIALFVDQLWGAILGGGEGIEGTVVERVLQHLEMSGQADKTKFKKNEQHIKALINEFVLTENKKELHNLESELELSGVSKDTNWAGTEEFITGLITEYLRQTNPLSVAAPELTENEPPPSLIVTPPPSHPTDFKVKPDVSESVGDNSRKSDRDVSTTHESFPDRGGTHLPTDRYLGPGNPLENGPPSDFLDAVARVHDFRYSEIQQQGGNPYTHFNKADAEFLKNIEGITGGRALLARQYFEAKKLFAPYQSLQAPLAAVPSWQALHLGMEAERPTDSTGGAAITTAVWANGATFGETSVTCFMTRRCYLPFNEDPGYKPVAHTGKNTRIVADKHLSLSHAVLGYQTPWHYVDVNNFALYFSPQEFQHLLETYESIAPKDLSVLVSDLSVKDVSIQEQRAQVTDSGTGGVAIFADGDYTYPYVVGSGQQTLPGDIPLEVYELPRYAYFTVGKRPPKTSSHKMCQPTYDTDFFILEHSAFKIYKTGDTFSHHYTFPSLPPKSLVGASQHFYMMGNPLYPSISSVLDVVGSHGHWRGVETDQIGCHPQNYFPGPRIGAHTALSGEHGGINESQKLNTGTAVGTETDDRISMRPLPACQAYAHSDINDPDDVSAKISVDAIAHGVQAQSYDSTHLEKGLGPFRHGRLPDDREMAKQLQSCNQRLYRVTQLRGTVTEQSSTDIPLMPGAVFNIRSLHYESQIWTKIPRLDQTFMPDNPALGGWGCVSPPPQVFFKMIPTPAPAGPGTDKGILHQYAVFNLTVKITFTVTKRTVTGRWNPHAPIYPPTASGHLPYLLYDSQSLNNVSADVYGYNGYERSAELWTAKARTKHL